MASAPQYQFSIRDTITAIVEEAVIASVDQYARRKPAAGQLGLFENPSEKQRPLFSKKIDESKGRWLTMRGTHVFVEGDSDGKERIVKGPKEFVGKTPSEMKEMQSAGSSKPKPLNELGKIQGKKKQDQRGLFGGKDVRSLFREGIEKHFEKMNAPKESANKPTSESSRPLDESFEENEGPLNGSIVDSEDAGWSDKEIIASCIDAKWSGKKIFNECKSAEWTDSQIVEAMENAGSDDKEIAALLDESGMPDRDLFNALDSAGWNDIRIEDACSAAGFSVARVKSILGDESESPEEPSEQAGPVEDALKSSFESALGESQGKAPPGSPDESEPFALSPPPKPSPKKQDFGNNEKSKQGGLFDAGKKGELKGQELLFNSDPGDLQNPKTMENRVKDSEKTPEPKGEDDGPKDGDRNSEGLVFRNGRWHRDGSEVSPADIARKARESGGNLWNTAKHELGVSSMAEIPPELRKELSDEFQKALRNPIDMTKPEPSPGRQRAIEKQEQKAEKEREQEQESSEPPFTPVSDAEESGLTPREQAKHYYDKEKHSEYAWARESEVENAGKDLLGSARHKRNEWRTLDELEKLGSDVAEEAITRANLMKRNPPDLMIAAETKPMTALAMHLAMNSIPTRPYGVKPGEVHRDTEKKKLARKQYVEAYDRLRAKAEEIAKTESDPMKALSKFANEAETIRREYSPQNGTYVREQFNNMITIHNRTQTGLRSGGHLDINRPPGRRDKSIDASTQIRKFAALAKEHFGEDWELNDDAVEKAIDVLSGSSIDKVFGTKKGESGAGKYKFNPAEAYVTGKTERRGGPSVNTTTVKKSQDILLDALKLRGLQYGNSMTDDERKHHTAKTAEALVDIADVLGLPDKAVGMNGKLGVAFGARGRAGAKAHYEPDGNVINLTRKTGAGSLAHEWAHFFDYNTGQPGAGQATNSLNENHRKLKEAWSAAKDRIREAVLKAYSGLSANSRWEHAKYWTSDEEMFARYSERMIQHKLNQQGRENSYLVGLQKKTHEFWPSDKELEQAMPHLESIYKDFADKFEKENGKEPKRDKYSRIQTIQQSLSVREVVRLEIDRYSRLAVQGRESSTPERQITPDQYAHPLVHAAVHAGLHAAVNATFRPGGLGKKLAHGLVAGAMAAWMAHAQASANQAAQNQAAQVAAQTQNQPRPTGAQLVANVVNNHLAARQAARQQAAHTASPASPAVNPAAPAAGSPKPVRPLGGTSIPPVSASTSAASSAPVTTTPGTGKRPLHEPVSSPDGIKRETTFHDGKRPGEFAPKDGGAGGAGGAVASDKSDESPESNSPRNYPDNLNKPASEQTPYSPPDRSIGGGEPAESDYEQKQKQDSNLQAAIEAHMDKILAGKSPARPNPRKAVREGRSDVPLQPISVKSPEEIKAEKKAEKQAEKQAIERIAFNPDELEAESSRMIDDNLADPGEKPKESDFQSSYKYEKAVQSHKRRAGAREAAIKRRAGKSVIPDVANEHDLDHDELRQAVDQEVQMLMPTYNRENEARQYISDMGWHSGRINRAEDSGRDHSRTNLDENASEWAGLFPEIAGPDESQWVDRMWELSKRGKQPAPSGNDEELVNRVAKRLVTEREQAQVSGGNPHNFPDVGPVQNEYGETVPFSRFDSRSGKEIRVIVDQYVRSLISGHPACVQSSLFM